MGLWILLFIISSFGLNQDVLILDKQLTMEDCNEIVAYATASSPNEYRIALSTDPTWFSWDNRLFKIFENALKAYVAPLPVMPHASSDTGYFFFKRDAGNKTFLFLDQPGMVISSLLLLNDNVGGGTWHFPRQNIKIEPECGRLVVWPSTFTHPHEIQKVTIGAEYFIMTWFK